MPLCATLSHCGSSTELSATLRHVKCQETEPIFLILEQRDVVRASRMESVGVGYDDSDLLSLEVPQSTNGQMSRMQLHGIPGKGYHNSFT